MDPNLSKIQQANSKRIKAGRIFRPIDQAKDYLIYIHEFNQHLIQPELDEFANHIKGLRDNG